MGTTTSYGAVAGPFALSKDYDYYKGVYVDWTGLQPSTTYHWRLRLVLADGRTFVGADQSFTTPALSLNHKVRIPLLKR